MLGLVIFSADNAFLKRQLYAIYVSREHPVLTALGPTEGGTNLSQEEWKAKEKVRLFSFILTGFFRCNIVFILSFLLPEIEIFCMVDLAVWAKLEIVYRARSSTIKFWSSLKSWT